MSDAGEQTRQAKTTVKIFLSSTSSDFNTEHDFLIENVYPKLKEYCRDKHGLDFQVVDMRFDEDFCLKVMDGAYFVALFSANKRAPARLPVCIPVDELDLLKSEMCEAHTIDDCYKLAHGVYKRLDFEVHEVDFNEIEDERDEKMKIENQMMAIIRNEMLANDSNSILDVVKEVYGPLTDGVFMKMFSEPVNTNVRYGELTEEIIESEAEASYSKYQTERNESEQRLLGRFQEAAKLCVDKGKLSRAQCDKYFISGTVAECIEKSRESIVFVRNIEEVSFDESLSQYFDPPSDAISFQHGKSRVFEYSVKWSDEHGISSSSHPRYLKKLGDDFYDSVTTLIDSSQPIGSINGGTEVLLDEKSMRYKFSQLESAYGKLLVSCCLFYLTAGISDVEIEDVLSLNDALLNEIIGHQSSLSSIRRFPIVLWYRLKYELRGFITQTYIDGVQVNCWRGAKVSDLARRCYVDRLSEGDGDELNLNLLDVYCETYKEKAKEYCCCTGSAFRFTSSHPLQFSNGYNMRKINRVLELTTKINDPVKRCKLMVKEIFLNYDFLSAALKTNFAWVKRTLEEHNLPYFLGKLNYESDDHLILVFSIIQQAVSCDVEWLHKFPESLATQLCSRLLGLYGISEHFTKFINDCEHRKCALVAMCQNQVQTDSAIKVIGDFRKTLIAHQTCLYSDTDDTSLSFYLCQSSVLKFEWNKQACEKSELKSVISLPRKREEGDYCFLRVFQQDEFAICVATKKRLLCCNEQGLVLSSIEFTDDVIMDLLVVGHLGVIVFYENRDYFDIYGSFTGKLLERKKYDSVIVRVVASIPQHYVWMVQFNETDWHLAIVFEDRTLVVYKVAQVEEEIQMAEIYRRSFGAHTLFDCSFEDTENTSSRLIAVSNGLKCLVIEFGDLLNVYGLQPVQYRNSTSVHVLKFARNIVFLQDDENLSIYDFTRKRWAMIAGVYKTVEIGLVLDETMVIYCSTEYSMHTYALKMLQDRVKIVPVMKRFHFNDPIFQVTGEPCVLLKNGVLIAINRNTGMYAQYQHSLFDRVDYKINKIERYSENTVMTNSNRSIHGWSVLDGTLQFNIEPPLKRIKRVVKFLDRLVVYGETKSQFGSLVVYNSLQKIESTIDIPLTDHFIIHTNEKAHELTIASLVNSHQVTLTSFYKSFASPISKTIDLFNYIPEAMMKNRESPIVSMTITQKSSYLVLILYSNIIFINTNKNLIMSEKTIGSDDLKYEMIPVENSDDILACSNRSTVFHVSFDGKIMSRDLGKCYTYTPVVKAGLLSILIDAELIIYNLGSIKASSNFPEPIFRHMFTSLNFYCTTADGCYLATHEIDAGLKLFRLKDHQIIAQLPPMANLTSMSATNQCLLLAIDDSRLLSYAIIDPNESSHELRLPRRYPRRTLDNKDINICMHSICQMLLPMADDTLNTFTTSYFDFIFSDTATTPAYMPQDYQQNINIHTNDVFEAVVAFLQNTKVIATPMGPVKVNLVDIGHNLDVETVMAIRKGVRTISYVELEELQSTTTISEIPPTTTRSSSLACNIS